MKDEFKDKIDGMTDKAKGKAKETAGKIFDDKKKEAEGLADQAKGEAKEKLGEMKDKYTNKDKE